MSKIDISFFNINWVESDTHVTGEACFGTIVINKNDNIAHIFGITGNKKWYPSIEKFLKNDKMRLNELKNRLNSYHLSRLKYITGSWITIKEK